VNPDSYEVIPGCFCEHCRAQAPIGTPDWDQWKRDRMTDLIAAEAQLIRSKRPGLPFSAAARVPYAQAFYTPYRDEIPYYSGWGACAARDGFSADWAEWLRQGHLDFVCPMCYFHSSRLVELQVRECQSLVANPAEKMWVGLGLDYITAEYSQGATKGDNAYRNDAAAIGRLLDLLESLGEKNCLFFSDEFLLDEHIPVIAGHRKA
jgi:hypothetical protein